MLSKPEAIKITITEIITKTQLIQVVRAHVAAGDNRWLYYLPTSADKNTQASEIYSAYRDRDGSLTTNPTGRGV